MMSVGVYEIPKVRFQATAVMTNNTTDRRLPRRRASRGDAAHRARDRRRRRQDRHGSRPRFAARTSSAPDKFPLTTTTGANYDSGEYEKALDAALQASGYAELRAEQAERRASQRHQATRHRRVDLRRGHRARRSARRVRRGRDPRRRLGQRVRRNQRARPRSSHRVRDAGQRGSRYPDGQDHPGQLRHRPRAARRRHDGFAFAADCRQRHPHRVQRGARPGPPDRRPHARGVGRRHRRRRRRLARGRRADARSCRGPSWRLPHATRRSCPPVSSPRRCDTSSTSTAATPRSRSARTCRSSRSTPRPARSRCCATSPSTTAGAS